MVSQNFVQSSIKSRGVLAPNAGLRAAIVPGPARNASVHAGEHAHEAPARMSWARLLKRVFDIDLEHCPQCGGDLKIIAAIRGARGDRQNTHAPGLACARPAALPGAAAGPLPGGLIRKPGVVLQRGRWSGSAHARVKR